MPKIKVFKFKIGQKVKIVKNDLWHNKTGKIAFYGGANNIRTEYDYYIKVKNNDLIGYNEYDLEGA